MSYILSSYFGFGDNVYHIPFVHKLSQANTVYITTPFPELFQFKNVYCYKPVTNLKLQLENMEQNPLFVSRPKPTGQYLQFNYGLGFRDKKSIMQTFEEKVPLNGDFYFEYNPKRYTAVDEIIDHAKRSGKKLCVLRLPSVRNEWPNTNRNAKMEYFQLCINHLKEKYYFVSVGDIGNREEFDAVEPSGIDEHRDRHFVNHLSIWEVFDLVNRSDFVISIQCNILPMCQILKKKSFFIYGGYVPHEMLNDPRFYQVGYVQPEPFCFCVDNGRDGHRCKKNIPEDRIILELEKTIGSN